MQCTASSVEVRLHEQISAAWTVWLVVVVLQWMHEKQLSAEVAESTDDAADDCTATTATTTAANADTVQELQVDGAAEETSGSETG